MVNDENYEDTSEEEVVETDEGEDSEDDSEPVVIRRNPSRGSRKKKVVKAEFSDEEDEDKSFWNQDFWKDDADKGKSKQNAYVDQGSSSSEDFSEVSDGEEPEEETDKKKKREPKKRKNNVYRDPRLHPKRKQAPRKRKREPVPTLPSRASTRTATKMKSAALQDRLAIEAEERKFRQAQPRKKRKKKPKMTQAERLREARLTEKENAKSLALLLTIEDNARKLSKKVRVINGPIIRTVSNKKTGGNLVLAFKDCTPKAHFKFKERPLHRRQDLCIMTKKRARYLDPITGQPYHDLQSFKSLRKAKKLKTKPT